MTQAKTSVTCVTSTQEEKTTLHKLFKKTAKTFPDNIAIVYDDGHSKERVTYSTLLNQASRVDCLIEEYGCTHQVIGLVLQAGVSVLPMILGVLQLESAFVNIDVDVPVSRLHYIIKQLHISLLLVQPHLVLTVTKKLEVFSPEVGQLRGHIGGQVRGQLGDEDLRLSCVYLRQVGHVTCESSVAYVMSTSGTTGTPKLVKFSRLFHVGPDDVVFQASPLTFDPSVVEMFVAMATGATLLCVPDWVKLSPAKMVETLCWNKTTVIQATPTLMSSIGSSRLRQTLLAAGSALRVLALGGEVCPPFPVLQGWREEGNSTRFYNLYGITEVSCWATCYSLTEADLRSNKTDVPLGDALEGTQLDIRPQPGVDPEKGVLWIGGSERVCFLDGEEENKLNSADGTLYRNSGDVVRRDSRGHMTYHGRLDEQIKRHGKRLNLVELEQTAACCAVVKQAAAIYNPESRRLGIVVSVDLEASPHHLEGPAPSSGQDSVLGGRARVKTELNHLISSHLPTYYAPDFIVIQETLPMTRHGKVDKKQLVLMEEFKVADQCRPLQLDSGQEMVSEGVIAIWKDRLHLMDSDSADLTSNFLQSGGNSLSALSFVSRVEALCGGAAFPVLLDVTLHQTLADVLVCVESTLRTRHQDVSVGATDGRTGGQGRGVTLGEGSIQVPSLGGGKWDNETVSVTDESSHSLTESQLMHQQHGSRKRKLSTTVSLNEDKQNSGHRHKEQCQPDRLVEGGYKHVENQENPHLFVCSVERGNRTCAELSSPTYCMAVVLTGEHIPLDTPSVTGEHISGNTPSVTGEHISEDTHNVIREHISVDTPSVTGEHISVDTRNVTGEHIPVDTPSITGEHISVDSHSIPGEHIPVDTPSVTGEHISVDSHSIPGEHIPAGTPSVTGELISEDTPNVTGEHIPVDTPSVTGEHISVDSHSIPGEHIPAGTPSVTGELISVDTPSVTGEHIPVGTPSVTGEHISAATHSVSREHISADTPSATGEPISIDTTIAQKVQISADTSRVRQETVGATSNMAADIGIVGRQPSQHTQPLPAGDITDSNCLVVMETWQHDTGKCVDASPLVAIRRDGSRVVFIGSHSHKFVALDLTSGHVIWRVQLGGRIEGSACLSKCGRFVMVGSYDGCLYILEALTGDTYWQFQTGAEVKSSPCVNPTNGHVYFGSHDHCLYALDVLTQTVVWSLELGGSVFSSPCVCLQPHRVYAATLGGSLTAVSPMQGTSLWRCMLGKPLFSSPIANELGVIIGCVDGVIYCVGHLGQKLWQHHTEAPVFSSPCLSFSRSLHSGTNHVIVFGSHDNHIYCIDSNGGLQWKVKVDSAVYSTPFVFPFNTSQHAVGERETPLSTHQTELCHQQTINSLQGSANTDMHKSRPSGNSTGLGSIQQKRVIGDAHNCVDLVAACSTRGRLYIVTLTSGRLVTSHQFPGETFSSPLVLSTDAGFDVIVGCRDDFVYYLKYKALPLLIQT